MPMLEDGDAGAAQRGNDQQRDEVDAECPAFEQARDNNAEQNRGDEEEHGEGQAADSTHHGSRKGRRRREASDVVAEGESDAASNQGGDAFHKRYSFDTP